MNHTQILKRAWNILWNYKMLWVFGFLLAITSASGGSNGTNYRLPASARDFEIRQYRFSPEMQEFVRGLERLVTGELVTTLVGLGIALVCLALLVAVVFAIVKYVSQVALIRMVDDYETTGEKVGFGKGWRLGWSRYAWRLFLIDLVVYLPVTLVFLILFGCAMTPMLVSLAQGKEPGVGPIVSMTGMVFMLLFLVFIVAAALSLVINLFYRACVMEGAGVIDSVRLGVRRLRERFKDVVILWLILIGVYIAYAIVLIPVVLLLLGIGLFVGGGAGLATFLALKAASQGGAVVVGAILGLGLLVMVMSIPLTFLEGLRQTYFSSTWTLAYRELKPGQPVEPVLDGEILPPPASSAGDTAPAEAGA